MCEELVKRLRNRRICIQQSGSLYDFPLLGEAAEGGMSMGIYLPNMEMPTEEYGKMVVTIYPNGSVAEYLGDIGRDFGTAMPVPPHGDLIGREWLIDIAHHLMNTAKNDDIANGVKWLWQYIIDAPTIIPADPEKEEMK